MKAIILLKEGFEECEALITYDLLQRAGIDVKLAGDNEFVTSNHNVSIKTQISICEIDDFDCLILPGGQPGTSNLEQDPIVLNLIDKAINENKYLCAICAAPSILLHKNLLSNNHFICFPGFEGEYTPSSDQVCIDNKIITGKALGASYEFSFLIIEKLVGKEKADEVKNRIFYKG